MSYLLTRQARGLMDEEIDRPWKCRCSTRAWRAALLAAVPVILHLFMRQTPQARHFPAVPADPRAAALGKKRMRVKNWLLLLRLAILALMATWRYLARPTLYSCGTPLGVCAVDPDTAHGAGFRHQPVDEIRGQGQDPAGRGQGAR